jgi:hypothetical protein
MSALLKHIAKGVQFFEHTGHCSKMLALVNEHPLGQTINNDPEFKQLFNEWFHTLNNTSWTMSELRRALEKLTGAILNVLLRESTETIEITKGRLVAGTVVIQDVTVFYIQTYDTKDFPGEPEYFSVPYYGFLCTLSQRNRCWDPHSATIWGMRDPEDVVVATRELDKHTE